MSIVYEPVKVDGVGVVKVLDVTSHAISYWKLSTDVIVALLPSFWVKSNSTRNSKVHVLITDASYAGDFITITLDNKLE